MARGFSTKNLVLSATNQIEKSIAEIMPEPKNSETPDKSIKNFKDIRLAKITKNLARIKPTEARGA